MKHIFFGILVCACCFFSGCPTAEESEPPYVEKEKEEEEPIEMEWKTISNPLILADAPDPSIIRVGKTYYMVSTTMYFNPGAPIMKSHDLVNWKLASYVYDVLEADVPQMNLESADANRIGDYGRGQWATSLRYHNGAYYVCFRSNTTSKNYFFQTKDIEKGPWQRSEIGGGGFHDPSLFFENGRVYVLYGHGETRIRELKPDFSGVLEGGLDRQIVAQPDVAGGTNFEGAHLYKIKGVYYLFLISWPSGGKRSQLCYRADSLEGPWEGRVVLSSGLGTRSAGVAQGASSPPLPVNGTAFCSRTAARLAASRYWFRWSGARTAGRYSALTARPLKHWKWK